MSLLCRAGRVLLLLLLATLNAAMGNSFLGAADSISTRADYSPVSLLAELELVLGTELRSRVESRAQFVASRLQSTYTALPKLQTGGIGADAVRYALHRYFVDRHGWIVQGLEPSGDAWNSSSPAKVFSRHAGEDVEEVFEGRLKSQIFDLHHTAVLAATLEALVHLEVQSRLTSAYRLIGLEHGEAANTDQTLSAVDTYMLLYLTGNNNHVNATSKAMDRVGSMMQKAYPMWEETRLWARSVHEEVLWNASRDRVPTFSDMITVVENIGDRYGRWQNAECENLQDSLIDLEEPGETGRVTLETFYRSALGGSWQFSENIAYLRQLGALDESDPSEPRVIIPNYIYSPTNCVAASIFYSVCCIDACEALMQHVEEEVAAPDASPEHLKSIVARLPSRTVEAPRELPTSLVNRLQVIADHHGGVVPLHGRLFAQWMHHAFPRECPYPHITGTTKPMTSKQWKAQTGDAHTVDEDGMRLHLQDLRVARGDRQEDEQKSLPEVPWSSEEELFVARAPRHHGSGMKKRTGVATLTGVWHTVQQAGRVATLSVALMSVVVMLARSLQAGTEPLRPEASRKHIL